MFSHLHVHYEVEDLNLAEVGDGVRNPSQKRRDVVLTRPCRIRLREVS